MLHDIYYKTCYKITCKTCYMSGNMLQNLKTCENGLSNFSENLRIVALKLLDLTQSLSPNLSIYSYLL